MTTTARGVFLSVLSSVLFGVLYYLATLLKPLTGSEIFGWRMLLTLPCLTILMMLGRELHNVRDIVGRVRNKPALFLGLCLSSSLIGVQQWLFLWAPINGSAINVSLGYFLLPLTILLAGRFLYREALSPLQTAAALVAAIGVAHDFYKVGSLSWETLLVSLGFPLYFVLRRELRTNNLGGLWFDMALMMPTALWFALSPGTAGEHFAATPQLYLFMPLVAVMSAVGFMSYIMASRVLPLGLFGLLGYVEPVLLFVVAVLIGEAVRTEDLFTYLPIMIAVGLLAADGVKRMRPSWPPA